LTRLPARYGVDRLHTVNNNDNNTQDDIYSATVYGVKPYARVHSGSSE